MNKRIEETFVHYKTRAAFERDLAEYGMEAFEKKIVFIKNEHAIWTHGVYYNGGPKHVLITQLDYDRLESYDNNTIYFITALEYYWTFGQNLPATFK